MIISPDSNTAYPEFEYRSWGPDHESQATLSSSSSTAAVVHTSRERNHFDPL
ncbi:hypothetical protein CY34DRAFT_805693 [Suillus luteus UH-Slu-Lm8-n1]|uniref:Uncharacterized protein n=1 Tax=Suillus luteus UH-Slu-Lm8-n1 TaxID=930992 RepID=A0A0D0AIM7_9AGAM|nr:hypothetical protein CY34DRAFT_805693 [Suillus luteus UH-Slu-Lm8-n1]